MDVDGTINAVSAASGAATATAAAAAAATSIAVHPLAIVNMSDQFTRVTCGGSPLGRDAPVVGLLFGKVLVTTAAAAAAAAAGGGGNKNDQQKLQVTDADDIPTDASDAASKQVELHRAVFPMHSVVGWYRVGGGGSNGDDGASPTANDVALTSRLQEHYSDDDATAQSRPFVFALLQVPAVDPMNGRKQNQQQLQQGKSDVDEEDEDEDELPLTLYQLSGDAAGGQVLEALEEWTLETSDAERIAVERVLREQPPPPSAPAPGPSPSPTGQSKTGGAIVDDAAGGCGQPSSSSDLPQQAAPSKFVHAADELEHSLSVLEARLEIVRQFLVDVQSKPPSEYPHALVRQVHSVLLHAHLGGSCGVGVGVEASASPPPPPALVDEATGGEGGGVQQLAFLAKTLDAVKVYTDKFKLVQEQQDQQHHRLGRGGAASALGGGRRGPGRY